MLNSICSTRYAQLAMLNPTCSTRYTRLNIFNPIRSARPNSIDTIFGWGLLFYSISTMAYLVNLIKRHSSNKPEFSIIDSSRFFCNACTNSIIIRSHAVKYCIVSHEKSHQHARNMMLWAKSRSVQQSFMGSLNYLNEFARDLAKMLMTCDIRMRNINRAAFREWVQKYRGKICPDESSLR